MARHRASRRAEREAGRRSLPALLALFAVLFGGLTPGFSLAASRSSLALLTDVAALGSRGAPPAWSAATPTETPIRPVEQCGDLDDVPRTTAAGVAIGWAQPDRPRRVAWSDRASASPPPNALARALPEARAPPVERA